jgi:hypothetical protein
MTTTSPSPRDLVARAYRATRRALRANDPAAFSAAFLALNDARAAAWSDTRAIDTARRADVMSPGELVRDADGVITGCRGLCSYA